MKSESIIQELQKAKENRYALGAFNIFNYLSARAIILAAQKSELPVILQTSTQTVRKFGPHELGTMLRQLAFNSSVNVMVHLDHCTDVELAKACIDAGWDSVMLDGSHLPLNRNIELSREVVVYAHSRGAFVEGELGRIAGVEDHLSVDESLAMEVSFDESLKYVKESGVDIFAPAIGTAHGVYKGRPEINYNLISQLCHALPNPIVIHGGSGLLEDTFKKIIECGGTKVNVSTAIKQAYIEGCSEYLNEFPPESKLDPIDFDEFLTNKIEETAKYHLRMFRGL